jgi:predicted transcriptional regulator
MTVETMNIRIIRNVASGCCGDYTQQISSIRVMERMSRSARAFRSDAIHQFHQHEARDIWSLYQTLKKPAIVARGLALGAISEDMLSGELRDKIKVLSHYFRDARQGAV